MPDNINFNNPKIDIFDQMYYDNLVHEMMTFDFSIPSPIRVTRIVKSLFRPSLSAASARRQYLRQPRAQRISNRFAPDVINTIRLYMPKHKKGKRKRTKPIFRRKRRN